MADNDGILCGGASYSAYDGSSIMTLDGHGQFALLEGSAADAANWTIDMKIMWLGGSDFQRVFTFGSSTDGAITFTPKGPSGTASFVLHHGTTVETLNGTAPLPIGQWVTVRISIGNGEGQLYIDGQPADDNKSFTISPQDVRPISGAIGAGLTGQDCFHGEIQDVTVYRTALFTPPTY